MTLIPVNLATEDELSEVTFSEFLLESTVMLLALFTGEVDSDTFAEPYMDGTVRRRVYHSSLLRILTSGIALVS